MSGSGGGGGGGGGGGAAGGEDYGYPLAPPPAPPPPDPNVTGATADINALIALIQQYQGRYTGVGDQMASLAGQYGQIAQGVDPRFAALRDARLNLFRSNAGAQLNEVDTMFGRQGLEGSGAALNARLKLLGGLRQQEQALGADLDMQQLQRQERAMSAQGQMLGDSLDPITAMLNLAAIPPALRAQLVAAQNAGQGGGGGGGGPSVICSLLYERGDLDLLTYAADCAYGRTCIDEDTFRGYLLWATPLTKTARKHPALYAFLRPFASSWASQMAFRMGMRKKGSRLGASMQALGQPLTKLLGMLLRPSPSPARA